MGGLILSVIASCSDHSYGNTHLHSLPLLLGVSSIVGTWTPWTDRQLYVIHAEGT